MEFIVAVALLVVLAVLAVRWGRDSRDGVRSKEHELAMHGVTWDDLIDARGEARAKHMSPGRNNAEVETTTRAVDEPLERRCVSTRNQDPCRRSEP